jgi:hypothetical protein
LKLGLLFIILMSDHKYINIEYIKDTEDTQKPSIVVFPNNFPKLDELNDHDVTKWGYYSNKDKKMKDDKLLLGENEKISYEGRSKTLNNMSE